MLQALRRIATSGILIMGLTGCVARPHAAVRGLGDSVPLFILAGQSNMQGQAGDAAAYPADPQQLDATIPLYWAFPTAELSSEGWTQLGPQSGFFPAGHFGPEISFARQVTQAQGAPVAIFKFSSGGTGLAADWKRPGEGGLYDQLTREYANAVEQLRQQGTQPIPQALIWIQGESDAETPDLSAQYEGRLELLIDNLRQNVVGDAELPVILGLDEQHPWVLEDSQVVVAQEAIAAADPNIIRTSMVGLEKADKTHLTPAGLVNHGERLALAWLEQAAAASSEAQVSIPDATPESALTD